MRISFATLRVAGLLVLTLALGSAGALAASSKDLDARMAGDGLQKTKVKNIDLVYARPGATLAAYRKVKLDPVEVAFSKSWNPTRTGSHIKLSAQEKETIRAGLAKLVEEEFAREIQAGGKYPVVTETGPDVLRVKAAVVNVYINAPDTGMGRQRTIVTSAGEMTLIAELSDGASGQVLARLADRREASNTRMQITNGVINESEARAIVAGWAKTLTKALDNAQGLGAK